MGLDRVQVYYDDILIAGRTEEEHVETLDLVTSKLEEYGLRLNEQQCNFCRVWLLTKMGSPKFLAK